MKCPKCKIQDLEIVQADVKLSRKGIRVTVSCENNCCEFTKVLELGLDDIICIAKSPETEAESRQAIAGAMERAGIIP